LPTGALKPALKESPTPLTKLVPEKALFTPGGDYEVMVFVTPSTVVEDEEKEDACSLLD